MKEDSSLNKYFNDAMADLSATQTRKILEVYCGFDGIATLVDVGGGKGATLNMIVSKYPSIKGINFDLPQVIEHAPPYPGTLIITYLPGLVALILAQIISFEIMIVKIRGISVPELGLE